VNTFDRWMLDTAREVVEVLAEANLAHDIEAEEHGPSRHIHWLPCTLSQLLAEQIRFGFDARPICAER
jgi:hypothetical protein